MSLAHRSAVELVKLRLQGEVTAVEVCRAFLSEIERWEPHVGAFLSLRKEQALEDAERVDARQRRGERLGILAGLPVAVKDVFCVQDEPTTCGSRMLERFCPPYDATVVARLRQADAILIGKTNMDEFAMGSSTENSAFLTTRNPWALDRVPGGSSGGAAAAVAAGEAPLSVGTDTGGSIRQPAAFCGVSGLKPTYGRVSRYGLVAFASSLDQAGPLARSAEDLALLLSCMAGHDPRDSTSAPLPSEDFCAGLRHSCAALRIGVIRDHLHGGVQSAILEAIDAALAVFREMGMQIVEVAMPHARYGIAAYYILAPCEASSNLARYDGMHYGYRAASVTTSGSDARTPDFDNPLVSLYRRSRSEGFGLEVQRRIMLGTFALSAGYQDKYYLKALRVRRLIYQDYQNAFRQVDLLLGPTTPSTAFRLGEKLNDPLSMYLEDLFTVGSNLAGVPALSIPCGRDEQGLPIGLQLQAPWFQEQRLLQVAYQFQQRTDWHLRRPELV